jgi:hypothetical protein
MGWNDIWKHPMPIKKVEEKNKKARLLVTADCPNKCPKCCNKLYNLNTVPVIDRWDYEEISITGGEPALFSKEIYHLIQGIREVQSAQGVRSKIFIYTSKTTLLWDEAVLSSVDGITYTPHNEEDVQFLVDINEEFLKRGMFTHYVCENKPSLRLYLFPEIVELLPSGIDLSLWDIKFIHWRDDCPIPEGEDFRRVKNLWKMKE